MKKITISLCAVITSLSGAIVSAEEATSHKDDNHIVSHHGHTLAANVGLYSNYIFRGLTQTNGSSSLQGGFDYSHSSGIYLGIWGSNVSWLNENTTVGTTVAGSYNTGGSFELDFYGGYKNSFGDFSYDVGVLNYNYPGTVVGTNIKADTQEVYLALGWKWISVKYSGVISTDVFGVRNASGTYYLDLSASLPMGETGLTFGAHYGIQKYAGTDNRISNPSLNNNNLYSYKDTKISISYNLGNAASTFNNMTFGIAVTSTSDATCQGYGAAASTCTVNGVSGTGVFPKNIAESQTAAWVSKAF